MGTCKVFLIIIVPLILVSCDGQTTVRRIPAESVVTLPRVTETDQGIDRLHPRLEVSRVALIEKGNLLEVRFRIYGAERISVDPAWTYVVDESTGAWLYVKDSPKIGVFPPIRLKEGEPMLYLVLDNTEGAIGRGSRVTVVIGGLKREHLLVQ